MIPRRTIEELRSAIDRHNDSALEALANGLRPVPGRPIREDRLRLAITNAGEMARKRELKITDGQRIAAFLRRAALEHPREPGKVPLMLSSGPNFELAVSRVIAQLAGRTRAAREVAELKLESGAPNEDITRENVIKASALKTAYELGLPATHAELVTLMLEIARHHQGVHRARLERGKPGPRA